MVDHHQGFTNDIQEVNFVTHIYIPPCYARLEKNEKKAEIHGTFINRIANFKDRIKTSCPFRFFCKTFATKLIMYS